MMPNADAIALGKQIKAVRKAMKMTQEQLALKSNVSVKYIIGIIFLTVFVSINLWAILTKNYSNSFLAGIAGMCLVTAILYLRKGKK